jgi:hypothetical protein
MKKITIDEFFTISSLLKGSDEDYQIAISNLINLKFKDTYILDLLFAKSLSLEKRNRYTKYNIYIQENDVLLIGRNLFNYITANGNGKLYKQILYRIMNT